MYCNKEETLSIDFECFVSNYAEMKEQKQQLQTVV